MEESAAERIAARKSTRPMPTILVPQEGKPAVVVGKRRSVERPRSLNTPITDRHFELIDDITRQLKSKHGRSWRINLTVELAIEDLARKLGILG